MANPARALALAALLAGAAAARAADAPPEQGWKNVLDFGLVNASGNTDVTTVNAADRLTWTALPWRFAAMFSVVYGETDGETTASTWRAGLRGERDLSPRVSVFGLLGWDRDTFAGIEHRYEEGGGVSFRAIDDSPDHLVFDAGLSFFQQRSTLDLDDNYVAARLAALYQRDLGEKAYVRQTLEVLPNLEDGDDRRLNSETSLVAPMWRGIALKVAYLIKYDHLPEPGFEETDRVFTTGIQWTH